MYAGVRWITNWIFNSWNNRIKQVKIEYSIVGMIGIRGSKYLIVGMNWNRIFNSRNDRNDRIRQIGIEY